MKDYVCSLASVDKFKKVGFVSLADYAPGRLAQVSKTKSKDKIAVLYANGEIVNDGEADIDKQLNNILERL